MIKNNIFTGLSISSTYLLIATCKIAEEIKGKSAAQIRERFNIQNDLTPERELEIEKEHAWVYGVAN